MSEKSRPWEKEIKKKKKKSITGSSTGSLLLFICVLDDREGNDPATEGNKQDDQQIRMLLPPITAWREECRENGIVIDDTAVIPSKS
jgi:hypothetical protein